MSYATLTPDRMAAIVQQHFEAEMKAAITKALREAAETVIQDAATKVIESMRTRVEAYRGFDLTGTTFRIAINNKEINL